jgi:CelD/BcsL family acetyltransferase involved in cellulose biosynthesis
MGSMNGNITYRFEVEVVTSAAELESRSGEWAALWTRARFPTVFQRPEWLLPWWRQLGGGSLLVFCLRHEGRLVGLAPFYVSTSADGSPKVLLMMGTGATDYLDALADSEFEDAVASEIGLLLNGCSAEWDVCDFQQLRAGSVMLSRFRLDDCRDELTVQDVCPSLPLPSEIGRLRESVPGNMLQQLANYRRRLAQIGDYRFETADEASFEEIFSALTGMRETRLAGRPQRDTLGRGTVRDFTEAACRGLLSSGRLRLYALRFGRRIVSALCTLKDDLRTYCFLSASEPAAAQLNPGTLILGHAIEQAIEQGSSEFDFLRGREAYKYLWGAKGRLNYRRRLLRTDARSSMDRHRLSELAVP